jgi:hypothetical protein
MSALVWLLPIIVVTVLAAAWTVWAARPKKPVDMFDSMQAHRKYMDALSRTVERGDRD